MTSLAEACRILGIANYNPNERYPCPLCRTKALAVTEDGRVGVKIYCHANQCAAYDYVYERKTDKRRGPIFAGTLAEKVKANANNEQQRKRKQARIERARAIIKAAKSSGQKPEAYLRARGIEDVPDNAYLLPANAEGSPFPDHPCAMFEVKSGNACAIVILNERGDGKAAKDEPKRTFGPIKGDHVEVVPPDPDKPLIIAEGIETALSASQLAGGLPAIATLGKAGFKTVTVPDCTDVIVAGDTGDGRAKAEELARRLRADGHAVRVVIPPQDRWSDWNDVLQQSQGAKRWWVWAFNRATDMPEAETETTTKTKKEEWPILDPEALYGLAGDIVHAISPQSEADPVALLVHVLAFFGNAAGRNAYYEVEGSWQTTNLYLGLVGTTSRARKGTALNRILPLFKDADQEWHDHHRVNGLSSGEGLIWAVRNPVKHQDAKTDKEVVKDHGVTDKRLCVIESEFGRVLKVMQRQGNTLSPVLREAWESGRLMTLTKEAPNKADNALISVIGHITIDELLRCLNSTDIANGLVNRFIFLAVRRSNILPHGGKPVDLKKLAGRLTEALKFASTEQRIEMNVLARKLWEEEYESLTDDVPGLFGAITARAAPQVIRLALLYALMDCSKKIYEKHLKAALALWRYSEASVKRIFGDALGDPIADPILSALRARKPSKMSRTDISNLFSGHAKSHQIAVALDKLLSTGKVTREIVDTSGRSVEMWEAI